MFKKYLLRPLKLGALSCSLFLAVSLPDTGWSNDLVEEFDQVEPLELVHAVSERLMNDLSNCWQNYQDWYQKKYSQPASPYIDSVAMDLLAADFTIHIPYLATNRACNYRSHHQIVFIGISKSLSKTFMTLGEIEQAFDLWALELLKTSGIVDKQTLVAIPKLPLPFLTWDLQGIKLKKSGQFLKSLINLAPYENALGDYLTGTQKIPLDIYLPLNIKNLDFFHKSVGQQATVIREYTGFGGVSVYKKNKNLGFLLPEDGLNIFLKGWKNRIAFASADAKKTADVFSAALSTAFQQGEFVNIYYGHASGSEHSGWWEKDILILIDKKNHIYTFSHGYSE